MTSYLPSRAFNDIIMDLQIYYVRDVMKGYNNNDVCA